MRRSSLVVLLRGIAAFAGLHSMSWRSVVRERTLTDYFDECYIVHTLYALQYVLVLAIKVHPDRLVRRAQF
jgi:hypothetical protein